MNEDNKSEGAKVPEQLQKALAEALHAIAIFTHNDSNMSECVIEIMHFSDAMNGKSETMVRGRVGGVQGRKAKPIEGDPSKLAKDMLKQILASRPEPKKEDK